MINMAVKKAALWKMALLAAAAIAAAWAGVQMAKNSISAKAEARTTIHNGQWVTDKGAGNKDATAFTRAYVAVVGLLALSREETVYYVSYTDENGEPLSSDNEYEIIGNDPPARWWSITLYDQDYFLTPNAEGKYSVKGTDIERDQDGSYRVTLSHKPHQGNWIPMGKGQNMSLLLRMYNPDSDILDRLDKINLPTIRKVEEE